MFKVNHQQLLAEFIELVQIDSPSKHERDVANYLRYRLEQLGYSAVEDDSGKKIGGTAGNLICRIPARGGSGQSILLVTHMDTVVSNRNVLPILDQGKIKTDGTTILGADDKAGIAAVLEGLRQIQERQIPHGPIEVIFTVAEELGMLGAKHLDYTQLQSKMGFVFDAGAPVGTVITKGPGEKDLSIEIRGREAHAGISPEEGINAIVVAGEILTKLPIGRISPEVTGNIGLITGGTATNIVPGHVTMQGEVRAFSPPDVDRLGAQWEQIVKETVAARGATSKVDSQWSYYPFSLTENTHAVRIAQKAMEKLGIRSKLVARGGGSDTNILNQRGIESVNLGVGVEKNHSNAESVSVEQLMLSAKLVQAIIWAGSESSLKD